MGYQALLFCPDEKLARIVAQVFTELEFNVETVQEPFSAVKKLMAQRYAALVVDCENESNASLLFKSARNSSSNQGILAIAVVEGQAGVAKAYRIGANLVLTKPINVEQAKGTLRVARGLLRKSADGPAANPASTPAASAGFRSPAPTEKIAAEPAPAPVHPVEGVLPVAPAPVFAAPEVHEPEPVMPAMAASVVDEPIAETPAPVVSAMIQATVEAPSPAEVNDGPKALPAASLVPPGASAGQAAAAAPAKVKAFVPVEKKASVEFEPVGGADETVTVDTSAAHTPETIGSTPSFSALELDQPGEANGSKKIMIAAMVLLVLAALGYFGWTKFASHATNSAPVQPPATSRSLQTPAPAPAPADRPAMAALRASTPESATASQTPNQVAANQVPMNQVAVNQSPANPVAPAIDTKAGKAPVPRIELDTPAETKAPSVAPLVVKSKPNKQQAKASGEDAAAPNPLAVSDSDSSRLNSLVATSGTAAPQVTLATLKLSQGVSQGLLIKRVDPKYPASALAMHVQGAVLLDATINREGQIANLKVVKGDQVLARAATEAVKQWRYKPYYLDGQPVEIQTQITVNFKLPN